MVRLRYETVTRATRRSGGSFAGAIGKVVDKQGVGVAAWGSDEGPV